MFTHIHNVFVHSLHVPAQTIEPLVSTLTERLVGGIGEHDEAFAAAPIQSYTKPPAPGKLLECLGAASTKSTATQTKPVELLTMGEAQDCLADLRVEEKYPCSA